MGEGFLLRTGPIEPAPVQDFEADFLVIAGGGGGGVPDRGGGGGGAGGYRTSAGTSGNNSSAETSLTLSGSTQYTVTVGAGGTGATPTSGNNSVLSSITSTGGGRGGGNVNDNIALGSGALDKNTTGFSNTSIGFDSLFKDKDGGIPVGASVLVEGGPGNGKTILCLNMIQTMCDRGKKVLYMSFEEPESRLREHLSLFGIDAAKYEKSGMLYLKRYKKAIPLV
jgi:hypothetical protein